MAWIASLSQDGCDYARVSGPAINGITGTSEVPYIEIGLNGIRQPTYDTTIGIWDTNISTECLALPSNINTDIYWKLAKAFAFISLVFGGGAALFIWFTTFFVFGPGTWKWAGYEVLLASLFQAFAFIWFNTSICRNNNVCSLYFGSKADIVSATFWFASALSIFWKYPIPEDKKKGVLNHSTGLESVNGGVMNEVGDDDSIMSDPDPGTKFPRADLV